MDADAVVSFDKIFLPTTIGGVVFSLVRDASSFIVVYPGVLLLLNALVYAVFTVSRKN